MRPTGIQSETGHCLLLLSELSCTIHSEKITSPSSSSNGWSVYKCPRLSKHGVPVLRSMFLHAQAINATTSFYGYANGDILFNNNLLATLEALRTGDATFKQVLVVGRRTIYMFKDKEEIDNLEPVYRYATAGKLFRTEAKDFFISTHSGFPWDSIPDFVVGRVGYDNW